ncbi:MAG: DUF2065 domain-containing protein [Lysobacteraceae bacterium]|nr:DUF2065 domain-containing protein [Xanthomonadales bacterium]HPF72271.1 DUF2065 domain-containing protein [Xanthomonadaceae bacterium]HRX98587.1 DUF2065 domain-containing protein [Xanthomonadaceae bacterium]
MNDLWAALCLVAVLEGLFLFAAPDAWKRMVEQAMQLESRQLRTVGGVVMALGLLSLYLVH